MNWSDLDTPVLPAWAALLGLVGWLLLAVGRAVRQTRHRLDRPIAGPPFNGRTPREWDQAQRESVVRIGEAVPGTLKCGGGGQERPEVIACPDCSSVCVTTRPCPLCAGQRWRKRVTA